MGHWSVIRNGSLVIQNYDCRLSFELRCRLGAFRFARLEGVTRLSFPERIGGFTSMGFRKEVVTFTSRGSPRGVEFPEFDR